VVRSKTLPRVARHQEKQMEIAAVILFSSVVLWIVEEAADEHI
jgi:hypothetical protein